MSKHPNHKTRHVGAMGMQKHYKSGKTTKSPKLRHLMMLEASKNDRKRRTIRWFNSVKELFL